MNIGIFGDSFADRVFANKTPNWVDHLAKKYIVDSYACSGSSLYYSVLKFYENHFRYEKIIFVATCPGRLFVPMHGCFDDQNLHHERSIPGFNSINHRIAAFEKNLNSPDLLEDEKTKIKQKIMIYKTAEDYLKYLQDLNYETYIHKLMLDDIIATRPDMILIPSFPNSLPGNYSITPMVEIQRKEGTAWGIDRRAKNYASDIRNCHMTAENNEIFASKVESWINGAPVDINLDDFVEPSMESRKFYISELE